MERRKLTKEDIDKVRDIEGFPIAKDEDIIALSDAPYYTACPNPFIKEFIEENGTPYDEETDDYHCEPFAADVSEGKGGLIYSAHNYHTKVPPKAIMRYILHYSKPGDIIYDGFCGTGMTGVAAQLCGNESIELKQEFLSDYPNAKWGKRKAVLNDLSPVASFISYVQNRHVDPQAFKSEAEGIIKNFHEKYGWMYETKHTIEGEEQKNILGETMKGKINYIVWSDVFICPHCSHEIVFSEVAFDRKTKKVADEFVCPNCKSKLRKTECVNAFEDLYDEYLEKPVKIAKQKPILINYSVGKKKFAKALDSDDYALIKRINEIKNPYWIPTERMPEGGETRRNDKYGLTHIHHFYTKRSQISLGFFMHESTMANDPLSMRFLFEQLVLGMAKISRYVPSHFSQVNQYLSGTLYVGSQVVEVNPDYILSGKLNKLIRMFYENQMDEQNVSIAASSTVNPLVPYDSIDYIFTDPPFGSNLSYSELNVFWEAWMKCRTNAKTEAIVNESTGKHLNDYQRLMEQCFRQYYKVLKPNRWMTVEFHNSKNAVWNAIQEALQRAGFIIADVRTLDKKQGTFKQINSSGAVKQDLVISAYKPKNKLKVLMRQEAGTEETAWAFVTQHLSNLPIVVDADHNGKIDIIPERQAYLLFDRMVAYHVVNGIPVPLDATDFYKGLDDRFLKRDDMYFLPDQVNEYDEARIKMDLEDVQMAFAVTNEKTAREWLTFQLATPQTYAEIQPKFMQEVKAIDKYEEIPELSVLLEENFIQDEKGRWYVPDIRKEGDVAKLREKNLLKEFDGYMQSKGKLKLFRSEAIRAGFSKLWKEKNYQAIVDMAERLPEQTIQEDQNLLMYYDVSLSRVQ